MAHSIYTYRSGTEYPFPIPASQGSYYTFNKHEHAIKLFYDRPEPYETRAISQSRADFELVVLPGSFTMMFFMYRFGDVTTWGDSPFHVQCDPEEERPVLDVLHSPTDRLLLTILLVDRITRKLLVARVLSLTSEFSNTLLEVVTKQSHEPFIKGQYDSAVSRIYAQYPTPKHLRRFRIASCTGGS